MGSDTGTTTPDGAEIERLRAQVERLQAENERMRTADAAPGERPAPTARKRRWRAWASALCIALAAVLVPVSILGGWTRAQLVDEQRFVDTFGPLASDPDVQALVIDRTSAAIDDTLDIEGLTDELFDGIASLDLPPASLTALDLLRAPAAAGARSLVTTVVARLVQSDAFAAVWDRSLVATHRALVAAATGGDGDALAISGAGELGIQLGPIIDDLRAVLLEEGFAFASALPSLDVTIVIAQADALTLVGPLYGLATVVGYALPFVALGLFVLGVLLARRRSTAVLGTGIGMLLGAAAVAVGLSAGGVVLSLRAATLGVPAATLQVVYDTVVGRMRDTALVLVVLGLVLAAAAWAGGRWAPAVRLRALADSLTTSARRALQRRGLSTGAFGVWLYRQRLLVRIALIVLAVAALVVAPRLTLGLVLGTAAVTLLAWLVLELLARHPDDASAEVDAVTDAA